MRMYLFKNKENGKICSANDVKAECKALYGADADYHDYYYMIYYNV